MAKSGTLNSSKYGDRYLKFTWERSSYNASKKQTTIKWTLKVQEVQVIIKREIFW